MTVLQKKAHNPIGHLSPADIEQIGVELDAGSLRFAKMGDWEQLRHELGRLQREVRESGSISYSAPVGEHDDLVAALSLCVYGCRRLVPIRRPPTRSTRRISPSHGPNIGDTDGGIETCSAASLHATSEMRTILDRVNHACWVACGLFLTNWRFTKAKQPNESERSCHLEPG